MYGPIIRPISYPIAVIKTLRIKEKRLESLSISLLNKGTEILARYSLKIISGKVE
jgi:hypothetical protein